MIEFFTLGLSEMLEMHSEELTSNTTVSRLFLICWTVSLTLFHHNSSKILAGNKKSIVGKINLQLIMECNLLAYVQTL